MIKRCAYKDKCRDFGDYACLDEKYCGFKENFMTPKQRKTYQKKHFGREMSRYGDKKKKVRI